MNWGDPFPDYGRWWRWWSWRRRARAWSAHYKGQTGAEAASEKART